MGTTWRQALIDAQRGIDAAHEARSDIFRAANKAGLSMRQIAGVVGLSVSSVHSAIGSKYRVFEKVSLLDAEIEMPVATDEPVQEQN